MITFVVDQKRVIIGKGGRGRPHRVKEGQELVAWTLVHSNLILSHIYVHFRQWLHNPAAAGQLLARKLAPLPPLHVIGEIMLEITWYKLYRNQVRRVADIKAHYKGQSGRGRTRGTGRRNVYAAQAPLVYPADVMMHRPWVCHQ